MALPPYYDLRTAALRLIGDGRVHRIRDVIDGIAAELDVGRADRALLTPKMRRRKFDIDVESAVADLRRAAWLENTALGRFRITAEGRAILAKGPKRIDARFLRNNSAAFRESSRIRRGSGKGRGAAPAAGGREFDGIAAVIEVSAAGDPCAGGAGGARAEIDDKPLRLMRHIGNLLEAEKALGGLRAAAFSGTLFITAEGAAREDLLLAFGRAVWPAVVYGIREDVQVCGCVAGGRLVRTAENWVDGPAAREAAANSDMPRWVGISAAPSANGMLAAAMPRGASRGGGGAPYIRHGLPIGVTAEQGAWAVDWPGLCDRAEGGREVEELVGIIDDRLGTTPDVGAAVRWWNTRRFCENALAAP